MEINSQFEYKDKTFKSHYVEAEPTTDLPEGRRVGGVHAICFCGDKMLLVYDGKSWGPPGGGIEKDESYQDAITREIREESNMRVLHQQWIGYQDVSDMNGNFVERQARMFCIVEPIGEFVSDPDNDIFEIKLIDPSDHKQYFDWLKVGDRIMERAVEMKREWNNKK